MTAADQPANASLPEKNIGIQNQRRVALALFPAMAKFFHVNSKSRLCSQISPSLPSSNFQYVWLQAGGEPGGWQRT